MKLALIGVILVGGAAGFTLSRGRPVQMIVDTGASGDVRGPEMTLNLVSVDGKEVRTLRGAVIEGLDVSLLGQSYLSRISAVSMSGDEMILR